MFKALNRGKLEYLLQRARQVEEGIMEDVQSLLQTDGLLRCLLNLLEDQWKSQPDRPGRLAMIELG